MEAFHGDIIKGLADVLHPRGIYERSDSPARALEGLETRTGVAYGDAPPDTLEVEDAGVNVFVDLVHGAKTGLFLDQRENQIAASRYAHGRDVLNCFSYTGLFGLRAAQAGAKSVVDVEISPVFQEIGERQWLQNRPRGCAHAQVTENAFDTLRRLEAEKASFGMIVLDPPAFTKSRAQRDSGGPWVQ